MKQVRKIYDKSFSGESSPEVSGEQMKLYFNK